MKNDTKGGITLVSMCALLIFVSAFAPLLVTGEEGMFGEHVMIDYHPMPEALEALISDDVVRVNETGDEITFEPVGAEPRVGVVIYAGALVDQRSYAPTARRIAEEGYFVATIEIPVRFGVPIPRPVLVGNVIEAYPHIEFWSVGGHSLGGVTSGMYFNGGDAEGLFFWASYPSGDLSDLEGEFMSIYGDRDGLIEVDVIEDSKEDLPDHAEFVLIEGGNHAQFGYYGPQDGDLDANITREEQQDQIVDATLRHLERIGKNLLTVDVDGEGEVDPGVGEHLVWRNEEVILTATSHQGWEFSHWSGDIQGSEHEVVVVMEQDMEVTANFREIEQSIMELPLEADPASGGWNLVSFNLDVGDTEPESILHHPEHGIEGSYDRVMYYDAEMGVWSSHVPGRDEHFNNLGYWDRTMGVWVRVTEDTVLTVEGKEPGETDMTLYPGWNLVGIPSSTSGNHHVPYEVTIVGHFDASQEHNIAYTHEVDTFVFHPGRGYWLYLDAQEPAIWTLVY